MPLARLLAVLAGLGIAMDERLGVRVGDRVCVDRAGRTLYRIPWAHTMSAWSNVYRPLKERFPAARYHFGKSFASFAENADGIVARFEDGFEARADLLIGADGLRSTVRAQLFASVEPAYAGYVAWRGIVEESALPADARQWLGNEYWMLLPPGEMFLCYPVPGRAALATPGARDWNIVWYRPVLSEDALCELCTDAEGRHQGLSMPPPLIRPEVIRRYKDDAQALLPPHIATLVERSPAFFQAIFDVASPRMAAGRVALLGDAAFVARHVGSYIEARARPHLNWTAAQIDQRPERVLHESAASLSQIPELAMEI